MSQKKQIFDIALSVRKLIETHNQKTYEYEEDLCGACALASVLLYDKLIEAGFSCYVVLREMSGGCHVYVIVNVNGEDHICDITATQFEPSFWTFDGELVAEDVMLLPVTLARSLCRKMNDEFWLAGETFKTSVDLIKKLITNGWPENEFNITENA